MSSSFKTYVDITEHGSEDYEWVVNEDEQPKLEPRLLPGEVIITSAENVLKFASVCNRKQGISGRLIVTNFKIAFVSPTSPTFTGSMKDDRNKLLGPFEICLANIDQVYQVNGDRKKKLTPGVAIVSNVKTLQIVCKDFSVHSFSFKFCPVGCHKTVINAILHHGFPKRIKLLFMYECTLPASQPIHGMQTFATTADWLYELERCNCNDSWRLCLANEQYKLSLSLPQAFVVPRSLLDAQIMKASKHFRGNRPPVWCWGHRNNCVIVRMASLQPFITETQQESIMLEHVRKSHCNLKEPLILELDKSMPLFSEIRASWCKLRDHCCSPVDNIQRFWEQDSKLNSLLSATRWPHHVCLCLRLANRVVDAITKHQISVVLQEGESRDTSAIISSLAQLIMDPYFRTIHGFQSLVQKEWIMLGHPFSTRFGRTADSESKQVPLFQLFLDCVWQLQHQFPTSFELTETYLTSLWDSLHNTVFDTFSFDSQRDHQMSVQDESNDPAIDSGDGGASSAAASFASRSVWDWELQFHDIDIGLFLNPLYSITSRVANHRQRRGLEVDSRPTNGTLLPTRIQSQAQTTFADGPRPRRSSISNLTLTRKDFAEMTEYGGHESADTLGRNWGSRLGLAAIIGMDQPHGSSLRAEGSSRWKKIRGALFHGHGRSFSPKTKISSIDEGLECTQYPEEPAVVTYRSTRSYPNAASQRWTVYGDPSTSVASELHPPTVRVNLNPLLAPVNCELNWDGNDVPFHELHWPVYTILPVADSLINFRLWKQCYLRWIPVLDIRGGGQPAIYFQHCAIVNDILSLEYLFYQLNNDDSAASPMQRFVTMTDQNSSPPSASQTTLSSFHPFVQQQNDSALSFGEWEIVSSPVAFADRSDEAVGPVGPEFDSESVVAASD